MRVIVFVAQVTTVTGDAITSSYEESAFSQGNREESPPTLAVQFAGQIVTTEPQMTVLIQLTSQQVWFGIFQLEVFFEKRK